MEFCIVKTIFLDMWLHAMSQNIFAYKHNWNKNAVAENGISEQNKQTVPHNIYHTGYQIIPVSMELAHSYTVL